jgi:hypothetical protein
VFALPFTAGSRPPGIAFSDWVYVVAGAGFGAGTAVVDGTVVWLDKDFVATLASGTTPKVGKLLGVIRFADTIATGNGFWVQVCGQANILVVASAAANTFLSTTTTAGVLASATGAGTTMKLRASRSLQPTAARRRRSRARSTTRRSTPPTKAVLNLTTARMGVASAAPFFLGRGPERPGHQRPPSSTRFPLYVQDRNTMPGRSVSGGQNDGVFAEFFNEPVELTFESAKQGKPFFEDRLHVRIFIAGDAKTEVVREATDLDKARFEREYSAFQRSESTEGMTGTPLKEWGAMTKSMVRNFAAYNVFTVEQLASISDGHVQNAGLGAREWRAKAQAFIEQAKDNASATALAAENQQLRDDMGALQRQLAELAARVTAAEAPEEIATAARKRSAA